MQTFLPYPDFRRSLECLDPTRLGNQLWREAKIIINGGWSNHPASRMWMPWRRALAQYALIGFDVLQQRDPEWGYGSGRSYPHHVEFFKAIRGRGRVALPLWLGDEKLHASHRAALLWKAPEWYGHFNWSEEPEGPDEKGRFHYYWPV